MTLNDELRELTRQARAWVEWLRDSGVDEHACEGDLLASLDAPQPRKRPAAPARAPQGARAPEPITPRAALPDRPATAEARQARLTVLADEVAQCTKCRLHEGRTQTVFSRGNPETELMFVGEGPGFEEDRQGLPFVGPAGQLLDKMIAAMGYARDEVYICNAVKCRPPNNRKPEPDEVAACKPYLDEQLALVDPKMIVSLGATGVQALLGTTLGITRLRGTWKTVKGRYPLMPTFHPAYLLRQPEKKREVWNDLQEVMRRMGKAPPPKRGKA